MLACEVPSGPALVLVVSLRRMLSGHWAKNQTDRYSDVSKELKIPDDLEEIFPREIHSESTAIHNESTAHRGVYIGIHKSPQARID